MQSIGNGVESLFVTDTGGGERRLKTAHHQLLGDGHGTSLKCPRCGSLNTKFCYYNNYNLSQPRFLCKGCRRYWTKGGVLRNVPVGGSSRKTKRSNKKSGRKSTDSHNSSCDNSSIVAANISPETTPFTLTEAEALPKTSVNQSFEPTKLNDNVHQVFSDMGTFRSLMTASSNELTVGFPSAQEVSQLTQQGDHDQVVKNQDWDRKQWVQATDGVMDSLVLEDHRSRSSNRGVGVEDWGLFDQSCWLDNPDHQLGYFF